MAAIDYHYGGFPPTKLDWEKLLPLIGLANAVMLSPIYDIPEYYLFAIFGGYFVIYTIASFKIPLLLRYSRRFRRKKPKNGGANSILKVMMGSFDYFRLIRKAKRYNVYLYRKGISFVRAGKLLNSALKFTCRSRHDGSVFEGKILDISSRGCMAFAKGLNELHRDMEIAVFLPLGEGVEVVNLVAEHIWVSEQDGVFYHGFRFDQFDEGREVILGEYLAGLGRKGQVGVVYHPS